MSKFVYEAGEAYISKTQCEGCIFQQKVSDKKCGKYDAIPEEITNNIKACMYYERKIQINVFVYEMLIDAFLVGIPDDIADAAQKAYLSYLHEKYDSCFETDNESEIEDIVKKFVNFEKTEHIDKTFVEKQTFLFTDEN